MKFTNVQLRHIGAIHDTLNLLEKKINELPVNVKSTGEMFVLLQCVGGNSIEPEFRPENKEDKVEYSLPENFPYDRYEVKVVSEPAPHLVLREIMGDSKYHFYTNRPGVINTV